MDISVIKDLVGIETDGRIKETVVVTNRKIPQLIELKIAHTFPTDKRYSNDVLRKEFKKLYQDPNYTTQLEGVWITYTYRFIDIEEFFSNGGTYDE